MTALPCSICFSWFPIDTDTEVDLMTVPRGTSPRGLLSTSRSPIWPLRVACCLVTSTPGISARERNSAARLSASASPVRRISAIRTIASSSAEAEPHWRVA